MKDITGASVQSSGNIKQAGVECSIDASGMGHIMSILSNMYSNKELAVLREYAANAWDAHVEAGTTDQPIEVTLPSILQPTLLIQDHGTGLSKDEVLNVFGSYGTSTKRETNDQVGALGIGSKSAFTLGQQFVVTAVKGGLKNVVLFSLNEFNVGTMKVIVEDKETDETNGVLISLGVEDVDAMVREAQRFFAKWVPGRVLVDGEPPESVWTGANKINDNCHILDEHDGAVFVMMGQISYEVSKDILRKVRDGLEQDSTAYTTADRLIDWRESSAIFFDVEIGDVDIAPSRESLRDTPRTVRALTTSVLRLTDTLTASVQAQVDAEPNAFDAVRKFEEVRDVLKPLKVSRKDISYKGLRLREVQPIEMPALFITRNWNGSYSRQTEQVVLAKDYDLESKKADQVIVVKIKDGEQGAVKRYAKRYLESRDYKAILLAVDVDAASYGWFTFGGDTGGAPVMTLEEYRAEIKALRESDPAMRTEPQYSTGWGSASTYDRDLLTDILSWGKDIVAYVKSAHVDSDTQEALADHTVIVLTAQQSLDALRKRVEKDGSVRLLTIQERNQVVADYVASKFVVTDEEKEAIGADGWLRDHGIHWSSDTDRSEDLVEILGEENITSRAFLGILDSFRLARMTRDTVLLARRNEIMSQAAHLGMEQAAYETPFETEFTPLDKAFPLAARISKHDLRDRVDVDGELRADLLAYINSHA